MASRRTSVNPKLVLHTEYVSVFKVKKICRPSVGSDVLVQQFEAYTGWVLIPLYAVINGAYIT
jgi:hypothetical protein